MAYAQPDVEGAAYDWIAKALEVKFPGVQIWWEGEGVPGDELTLPYVLLNLISLRGSEPVMKVSDTLLPNGNYESLRITQYTGRLRVQVIGSSPTLSAWTVAMHIEGAYREPYVAEYLESSPLKPGQPLGPILNPSAQFETAQETRTTQDYPFAYVECIIDDEQGVGSIERVTADGDIGGVTVTATAQSP